MQDNILKKDSEMTAECYSGGNDFTSRHHVQPTEVNFLPDKPVREISELFRSVLHTGWGYSSRDENQAINETELVSGEAGAVVVKNHIEGTNPATNQP